MKKREPILRLIKPNKYLSQNFLIDEQIKKRIISACELNQEETILEIGPGLGALTREIYPQVKAMIAVEKDPLLCSQLKNEFITGNISFIEADFLKFDLRRHIFPHVKVIGNIPYHITSPIIEKLLSHRYLFTSIFLTIQKEVAERLCAKPHTKEYGALSCFVQYYTEPQILIKIGKQAFRPIPKVDSCFVKFKMRTQPLLQALDEDLLFSIVTTAFQNRRKKMVNALSARFPKKMIEKVFSELQILTSLRAENLSLADFVHLTNAISMLVAKLKISK